MGPPWWARGAAATGRAAGRGQQGFHRELLAIAPGAGMDLWNHHRRASGGCGGAPGTHLAVSRFVTPWAPREEAEAQLLRDAVWATRGETRFSTLTPSLIMRSYTGAYARNQPKHAGSCVQKIAVCQRSGQALQKVLGGEQPLSFNDCAGSNQWPALANSL